MNLVPLLVPFMPPEASDYAGRVDLLFLVLMLLAGFFLLLVTGLLVGFSIRYRSGAKVNRDNPTVDNPRLEWFWTLAPLAMGIGVFIWAAHLYLDVYEPPAQAQEVLVVGKQWMWKIQHAEGKREINTLHVPMGAAIKLKLTSQDVIHSFYVPAFRMKRDAVPGRYTTAWFRPTRLGTYHLFCAEYCGTNHSAMTGSVIVMRPDDYARWLAGTGPTGKSGEQLFTDLSCVTCHTGPGRQAPLLGGLPGSTVTLADGQRVLADDNYLRDAILHPAAQVVKGYPDIMPTFQGIIDEGELMKLIQYIKSLPAAPDSAGGGHGGGPAHE